MTKDEALAMDLALEALELSSVTVDSFGVQRKTQEAITAIKQARALDKMAENARELGLDYEPAEVLGHNGWGFPIKAAAPVQKECDCAAHSAADCVCGAWDKSAVAPVQEDWGPGPHECHSLTAAPVQEPPPECQTEAEKRAYAFGWWKALEANRATPVQEPVAWRYRGIFHEFDPSDWAEGPVTPLYTTPPAAPVQVFDHVNAARQGLRDAQNRSRQISNLINCGTCGYPLAPEERTSLIERDGVMVKPAPVQEPDEWLTGCPECGMDSGCDCDSGTWNPPAAPVQEPDARIAELEETVRQLNHALGEATEVPTFMGEPVVAAPTARIKGFDEYGPLLEWSQHWVNFPVGTKLYTTPPAAPVQEPVKPTAQEMQNAASNLALMREMWGEPNQPAARVNDEGFIVETGLLLSPGTLLYTTPPAAQRQWVRLTNEEIAQIYLVNTDKPLKADWLFARAIEAKLKELNT